jgi:hypothetical protein
MRLLSRMRSHKRRTEPMNLPDQVESKLRDAEAIVLPRIAPVKKGRMIIHYHCDGKSIGETTFTYTPEAYADWFRSMANLVSKAQKIVG